MDDCEDGHADYKTGKSLRIAVEEKFDLILENSVYASPNIDITQKVIKALNDQK